eukprot:7621192-Alexandrium_andersonii.AAC.1
MECLMLPRLHKLDASDEGDSIKGAPPLRKAARCGPDSRPQRFLEPRGHNSCKKKLKAGLQKAYRAKKSGGTLPEDARHLRLGPLGWEDRR